MSGWLRTDRWIVHVRLVAMMFRWLLIMPLLSVVWRVSELWGRGKIFLGSWRTYSRRRIGVQRSITITISAYHVHRWNGTVLNRMQIRNGTCTLCIVLYWQRR